MEKTKKSEKAVAVVLLTVLIFFFASVMLRTFVRQVCVKHFGMSNPIIDLILFDVNNLNDAEEKIEYDEEGNVTEESNKSVKINWEELYPFEENVNNVNSKNAKDAENNTIRKKISDKITPIEGNIEVYATDYIPWYKPMTEVANTYENLLQWDMPNYSEYNSIIHVDGNYLAAPSAENDVTECARSTAEFAKFCEDQGSRFLFCQQPSKICIYDDTDISGSTDFSNQNIDKFLNQLQENGVNIYDHRKDIHEESLDHHSLFFDTDHHWSRKRGFGLLSIF